MKLLSKIRDYICYCGIDGKEYKQLKKDAYVANFEVWRILHIFMVGAFAFLTIYTFFTNYMSENIWFYLAALIYSVLAGLPFFLVKRKDALWIQFLIYLSISLLFLFACFITANKPDMPAITFIAFLLITPMFMIDKPYFMSIELIVASTVYLIWMSQVKTPEVYRLDLSNVIMFTLLGIFIHIMVNSFRIKEFVLIRKINIQKDLDELTGLKNKASLTREINEFVESSDKNKGLFFVLDIDYFKHINDSFGHDVGDVILDELGSYFKNKFTNGEIVGRFGGDEFIIFIKDQDDVEYAKKVALEVANEVQEKIKLPEDNGSISVSIGVAIYQGEEKHYSEIFKRADVALYETKANRQKKFTINQ